MSEITICNNALTKYLGVQRITSLVEESAEAEMCAEHYDRVREMVLEAHWWTFATGRQRLAQLVNDREDEWIYRYSLPPGAMSLRWVNEPRAARTMMAANLSPDTPREITVDSIYSDTASALAEFTQDVTDTNLMPQAFKEAIAAHLAAAICMPITKDKKLTGQVQAIAPGLTSDAIAQDMRNTPPQEAGLPHYLRDRGLA